MRASNRGLLLLAGLLLVWAVGGYVFHRFDHAAGEREYRLLADLVLHKRNLAATRSSPRVLVAGGSNAYYGIDTNLLRARLGIPTVNMALPFGGHHVRINLALLTGQVRRGDIILFADADFWHGAGSDDTRLKLGFDKYLAETRFPGYVRQFNESQIPWLALPRTNNLLLGFIDGLKPHEGRPWVIDTDARGNYTGCVPAPVITPQAYRTDEPDAELAASLREAAQQLDHLGARLIVSPPQMLIRERERRRWLGFETHALNLYRPAMPVIGSDPREVLRSDRRDFCDSPFHLSTVAARRRTELLATELHYYVREVQPESPPPAESLDVSNNARQ